MAIWGGMPFETWNIRFSCFTKNSRVTTSPRWLTMGELRRGAGGQPVRAPVPHLIAQTARELKAAGLFRAGRVPLVSAGGSSYFDRVVARLGPDRFDFPVPLRRWWFRWHRSRRTLTKAAAPAFTAGGTSFELKLRLKAHASKRALSPTSLPAASVQSAFSRQSPVFSRRRMRDSNPRGL